MKSLSTVFALTTALIGNITTPTHATELSLIRSFYYDGPSGLSYDKNYCGIWVANETSTVRLIDLWGHEVRSFNSSLRRVDAIAVTGKHLILSDGSGLYQKVDTNGKIVGPAYRPDPRLRDTDGLYVDANGTHWVADDTLAEVVATSRDGHAERTIIGKELEQALMEPQGITIEKVSGRILVVDDADASDSLFEFSADGKFLGTISLKAFGEDAEGITTLPNGKVVIIAFDKGNSISLINYKPANSNDDPDHEPSACAMSHNYGQPYKSLTPFG